MHIFAFVMEALSNADSNCSMKRHRYLILGSRGAENLQPSPAVLSLGTQLGFLNSLVLFHRIVDFCLKNEKVI